MRAGPLRFPNPMPQQPSVIGAEQARYAACGALNIGYITHIFRRQAKEVEMHQERVQTPIIKFCPKCSRQYERQQQTCPEHNIRLAAVDMDPLAGTSAGQAYEVLSVVGRGGTSLVYKARHRLMDRNVAIKVVKSPDDFLLKRFEQEAKAVSCLDHPNVVSIYDFGTTPDGKSYIVMEYLEGRRLSEVIAQVEHLPYDRAIRIFSTVCEAMEHAHLNGVVHLDLKPSNIVLVDSAPAVERVKVVDFGIADLLPWASKARSQLIEEGQAFGSPLYMSPEQFMNYQMDLRSDVYALACTMYEALTGQPPYKAESIEALVTKKLIAKPASFNSVCPDTYIPEELERIVFKGLSADKSSRHQSMSELKEDLRALAQLSSDQGEVAARRNIQVMIVEDNPVARLGLQADLSAIGDLRVVAEAENGLEAVQAIDSVKADVILMDIEMPVMNGIEATKRIKERNPDARIIMFTMHDDPGAILAAFGAGADGYCVKNQEKRALERGIRSVAGGGSWLDATIASRVLRSCALTSADILLPRQPANVDSTNSKAKPDHEYLIKLADAHYDRREPAEAEALYRGALAMLEKLSDRDTGKVVWVLVRLADICCQQERAEEAESLFLRALEIREQAVADLSVGAVPTFSETVVDELSPLDEAQRLYLLSLHHGENIVSLADSDISQDMRAKLAWVYRACKKYRQADQLTRPGQAGKPLQESTGDEDRGDYTGS